MRRSRRRFVLLVALYLLWPVPSVRAQGGSAAPAGQSFWQAAAGVAVTNWFTWAYNWYVQRWPWANVGVESWRQNIRRGFAWDNDCFIDNQLAHPYHGSMYHNSARASGYGFWASVPFVAAGSASWELFGENIPASLNDLINTTLGGVALGEVTYRLSTLLGQRRDGRRAGVLGELGAFGLSPLARVQSLVNQRQPGTESSREVPTTLALGRRSGHPFFELAVQYGSPFAAGVMRPYDAFDFRIELAPGTTNVVHQVEISGLLARYSLSQAPENQLLFGVFQHYDYSDLPGIQSGGHSVSAALLYQGHLGPRHRLDLNAHAEALLLGGISSDHDYYWRRDFDLGPGAGARLGASLVRDGRERLRVDGRLLWIHSIHGSRADHLASFLRVGAAVPMAGALGVGGDFALVTRHSIYDGFPSVTRRVPQLRAFLTWAPS